MLARLERELPERGYFYEPKWDGFRAVAFRDGEWVELQSRNLNPFGRYFPELAEALRTVDERRFVLDGEIVIPSRESFDFGALLKRVHPACSRVDRLRHETPATYVAFDLRAAGDEDLRRRPFAERRHRLELPLHDAPEHLFLTRSPKMSSSPGRGSTASRGAASTASSPKPPRSSTRRAGA